MPLRILQLLLLRGENVRLVFPGRFVGELDGELVEPASVSPAVRTSATEFACPPSPALFSCFTEFGGGQNPGTVTKVRPIRSGA